LRGLGDDQTAIREAYLDALGITPGEHVLDVGSGTGVVAGAVARRLAPNGRLVGVEPSPAMLAVARELAEREELLDRVEFRTGDARELPFADSTFDVVLAITALSRMTDAERGLPELIRVTRPGGRIGIFDIDSPSWVIAHPDRAHPTHQRGGLHDRHRRDRSSLCRPRPRSWRNRTSVPLRLAFVRL
jgi:ubiquinone/menaquinone biosynthesis C-methylase UbiE